MSVRPDQLEVRAELLSPAELDDRITRSPVVYIPLGSLEYHGPHLPIGLDALTAHGVCVRAALATGGVVLPVLHLATGGGHTMYPWTIMMRSPDGIREHLGEVLDRLDSLGVEIAVLFTGHFAGEQRRMVHDLAVRYRDRGQQLKVISASIDECPGLPITADHAGTFESTVLHALHPELVHLDRLPAAEGEPDQDPWGSHRHNPEHPLWGVFGSDPRGADLTDSRKLLGTVVTWLVALAQRT